MPWTRVPQNKNLHIGLFSNIERSDVDSVGRLVGNGDMVFNKVQAEDDLRGKL